MLEGEKAVIFFQELTSETGHICEICNSWILSAHICG